MRHYQPLAERMRPQTLEQVLGQGHLLATGAPLRVLLERGQCPSLVFWGTAGVGKMLSGDPPSSAALINAKELIQL